MGFHTHQSLPISAARGSDGSAVGSPCFSQVAFCTLLSTLELWKHFCGPWQAGRSPQAPPWPATHHVRSIWGPHRATEHWGAGCSVQAPGSPSLWPFLGVPLLPTLLLRRPPVLPERFAQSFSPDGHRSEAPLPGQPCDSEPLLSTGKGWSTVCLPAVFICLFSPNGTGHGEHFPEASIRVKLKDHFGDIHFFF